MTTTTIRNEPVRKSQRADACRKVAKRPAPSHCPECGAVFSAGRWVWRTAPKNAQQGRCPACVRIATGSPAGYLELGGDYLTEHRDEIINLLRNTEALEKSRHPMERIMGIAGVANRTKVTTTGVHLARRMGAALKRSYSGDLSVRYLPGDQIVQVGWQR